jgi:hypothetical protein
VKKTAEDWQVYRSKFLIRAKRLTSQLSFVDALGHEQRGKRGDYLVESGSGLQRIWPRQLFEDAHVPLDGTRLNWHPALFAAKAEKRASAKVGGTAEYFPQTADNKRGRTDRKAPVSCGKEERLSRIPAVNCLRYNM